MINERGAPLFNAKHQGKKTPMSDDNDSRFLKKHAAQTRTQNPQVPDNVHPHMFRHSRAMYLYQGGIPLAVISLPASLCCLSFESQKKVG